MTLDGQSDVFFDQVGVDRDCGRQGSPSGCRPANKPIFCLLEWGCQDTSAKVTGFFGDFSDSLIA